MEQRLLVESIELLRIKRKQLDKAEKRILELDKLFVRICEDSIAGKLRDERFSLMSGSYDYVGFIPPDERMKQETA